MARPWFRVLPPELPKNLKFHENVGAKHMPEVDSDPIVYFHLLFSTNLIREIVRQTNRYARRYIHASALRRFSRVHSWRPVTLTEMKGFLSVLLNMGILKKPTIPEYWNQSNDSQDTPWFRKMFSRNRFQLIMRFFHLVDNRKIPGRQSPQYKPDLKFKPLLNFANRVFHYYYTPSKHVCVDETLVATRGKTAMLQYIPSKAETFGVKFWVLADSSTGYVQRMNCYLGKRFEPIVTGLQGTRVVLDLLRQCHMLNKRYHVVVDSFFCSIDLARRLLQNETFVTGTLRSNRPMPLMIKHACIEPGETLYMRQGDILLAAYKNTYRERSKPVRVLSTAVAAYNIN